MPKLCILVLINKNVFFSTRIRDSQQTSQATPERINSVGENGNTPEVFSSPEPLKSPVITVTAENGTSLNYTSPQESQEGTPKLERKETLKTSVKRSDSISRQKSFNRKYELSPELQDRSVKFLERQYGGREKAHHAARVIQSHYRKYRMDKQFKRMRTYSFTPGKDSFRTKSNSDPNSQVTISKPQNSESQVTPVLRIKKKRSGDKRVKSILIIDNINSLTGGETQMYTTEELPMDLTSIFNRMGNQNRDSECVQIEVPHEKEQTRLGSVMSETDHYVKVEIVDNVETLPDDAFVEDDESKKVPNGDLPRRPRKETFTEDGSVIESDESGLIIILTKVVLRWLEVFLP